MTRTLSLLLLSLGLAACSQRDKPVDQPAAASSAAAQQHAQAVVASGPTAGVAKPAAAASVPVNPPQAASYSGYGDLHLRVHDPKAVLSREVRAEPLVVIGPIDLDRSPLLRREL